MFLMLFNPWILTAVGAAIGFALAYWGPLKGKLPWWLVTIIGGVLGYAIDVALLYLMFYLTGGQ